MGKNIHEILAGMLGEDGWMEDIPHERSHKSRSLTNIMNFILWT